MPSATDVYITPASRKIEWYQSSAVKAEISGSSGDLYVSGSGDLQLDAEGNNINLLSAGTKWGAMNNNNAYWDFDGNAGSSYFRFIPWNGGAGTTAYTYWGDGTHNQVIYVRGTDSINTNSTTITNTWFGQYDGAGNLDTYLQAGGDSYILNDLGIGTSSPSGRFNVSGGATTLDNAGNYALYFKNAGTQYGAIDTYGGSLSIEAASEAILSGASGVVLKGPGIFLGPTGTSAGDTQELKFRELAANGTAAISIKAPDSISNENRWILPADIGTANQVLTVASVSSTSMTLGWTTAGGISGLTGLVENSSIWLGSDPSSTTNDAYYNNALGVGALDAITTGDYNNAIGYNAMTATTTGVRNEALGYAALFGNVGGNYNVALGMETLFYYDAPMQNTVVGYNAMFGADNAESSQPTGNVAVGAWANFRSTGNYNTAVGHEAMYGNSDAALRSHYNNVGVGRQAGYDITTGYGNAMLGYQAAANITTGYSNVAIGNQAAFSLTTGRKNIAVGNQAGYSANGTGAVFIGEYAGGNSTANYNVLIGFSAGDALTTGGDTVAIGQDALGTVSTGVGNTAVGREAMRDIAAGGNYNTGIGMGVFGYGGGTQVGNLGAGWGAGYYPSGNYNVFMGFKAGYGNSSTKSAHQNVGIGSEALFSITSGDNNVAVGYQAGYSQTTGDDGEVYIGYKAGRADYGNNRNIAIGSESLISNTTGSNHIAIGYKALESVVDGVHNIAIGREAGKSLTKNQNVAIGTYAMTGAVAQYYNTAVGDGAMRGSTGGDRNTAIGYHAIGNDSTGTGGGHVTAVGFSALRKNSSSALTAIGYESMNVNTSGEENVAVGYQTLVANTTGSYSTAVGYQALKAQTTGNYNTAFGGKALYTNVDGDQNVAIGWMALYDLEPSDGGGSNVAVGTWALQNATTGHTNVGIGTSAGNDLTTGERNVIIGHEAGRYADTMNYSTVVGNNAATSASGASELVVVGRNAAYYVSGSQNTAIGANALMGMSDGTDATISSVAIGRNAMYYNSTANYCVAVGESALVGNSSSPYMTGDKNVAIGREAMTNVSTGHNNTGIGYQVGQGITTGYGNVLNGYQTGKALTDGVYNTMAGAQAGLYETGDYNVMIGHRAGEGGSGDPDTLRSVFVGYLCGYRQSGASYNVAMGTYSAAGNDFSGASNVMIGYSAGEKATTANANTLLGYYAGSSGTTHTHNTMIGNQVGQEITTGTSNVFAGSNSGRYITIGHQNVGIGYSALNSLVEGDKNVAIGGYALHATVSADGTGKNIGIGYQAGYANTTGTGNIFIGHEAGNNTDHDTESNKLVIANSNTTTPLIGGDFSAAEIYLNGDVGIGTTSPSHPLHVYGADNLLAEFQSSDSISEIRIKDNTKYTRLLTVGGLFKVMPNDGAEMMNLDGSAYKTTLLGETGGNSPKLVFDNPDASNDIQLTQADSGWFGLSSDGGTTQHFVLRTGNVGIGTTSPDEKFHVYDGAISDGAIMKIQDSAAHMLFEADHIYSSAATWFGNGQTLNFNAGTASGATHYGSFMRYMSGSTEIWRATDTGLGIGTTTPNYALDVNGDIRIEDAHYLRFGGNGASDSEWIIQQASNNLNFGEVGVADNVLYLKAGGNVGIGTAAPSRKLEVNAGSSTAVLVSGAGNGDNAVARIVDTVDTTALEVVGQRADGEGPVLRLNHESASVDNGDYVGTISFEGYDSGGARSQYAYIRGRIRDKTAGAEDGSLYFQVAEGNSRTDVMTLSGTNVGIGTTSPSAKLHLKSSSSNEPTFLMENTNADDSAPFITFNKNSASPADGDELGYIVFKGDDSAGNSDTFADIYSSAEDVSSTTEDGSLTFRTNTAGTLTKTMVLRSSKVGIGTTSPQQTLHVEGTFRFRDANSSSQRLEGFGWNDNFALVVSGTDALGLVGGTPGVRFLDQSANEHLAIKESGTNHAQFMAGGENLLVMTNDKLIMDQGKGIQHAVGSVTEWLPDMAGSSLEGSITTWDKIQKIRTDSPPINWGGLSSAKLMLPAATAGREHIIVWSENQSNLSGKTFSLNPAAGGDELWKAGVTGPVGINKNTGESIHVICAEAGIWSVVAHT